MLNRNILNLFLLVFTLNIFGNNFLIYNRKLEEKVEELKGKGNIPEFNLVIIENDKVQIENYGNENSNIGTQGNSKTLFEIGSTSKAFTALAILKLEEEGKISLNDPISKYLLWFQVNYEDKNHEITINQALHHTTGIPWNTISNIPESNSENALEQMIKTLIGYELKNEPGTKYEYVTINYDILGLIIEKVSGISYEKYMEDNIFKPLRMDNTSIGIPKEKDLMSTGYKIGFFSAREYDAPIYKGNWPAGYVITNAEDMAKWLKFQLGITTHPELSSLIEKSHMRDKSVSPNQYDLTSYAAGWNISLKGDGIISHGGMNPNFTSYIGLIPEKKIGVAVLANSNSAYTEVIGDYVLRSLSGEKDVKPKPVLNSDDKVYSLMSIILAIVMLSIISFIVSVFIGVFQKKRVFTLPNKRKILTFVISLFSGIPFVYAIYLIPTAMADFNWESALVWSSISFASAVVLSLITICSIYVIYLLSILFPSKNKYKKSLPLVTVLSLLSGLANSVVIFIIIHSVYTEMKLIYLLYYFSLVMVVYIIGRKVVQTKLLKITFDIIYDIRINLIEKIFSTSYQKFEKIDRGKVYATLQNDTAVLGGSANVLVNLITSVITTVSVFVYLAIISFCPTMMAIGVIAIIATLYYYVSERSMIYFNEARDTQNTYMELLNGMLDGFRELSINRFKKKEYRSDIEGTVDLFRKNASIARVKFINAFLIGESLLIMILGFVSFAFPKLFPDIQAYILMSFIMVLLYLIGPINGILNSIPAIMELRVSWNRIQEFVKGVPSYNINLLDDKTIIQNLKTVENIKLEGIEFEYRDQGDHDRFAIGPIDIEVKKGEILFIIGGNGSGKTTLANLITGLYEPDKGMVRINEKEIHGADLGENFSIVFSDYNLFGKLYNIDTEKNEDLIKDYFKKFYLEKKVKLTNGSFSTTKLSNGQRKRLALIKCFLEDSPIYLFDEVAADQDPDFKKYFYKDLLQQMKKEGKIIIAITHDDHYFDVADKILKLNEGKVEFLETRPHSEKKEGNVA